MISEINRLDRKDFDFVIVGAGPAGITLALDLEKYGINSLLIEGGSVDYSTESQALYNGKVNGNLNYDIKHSRLRYFGGSTNHWGGMCRPLSESELAEFPLDKKDLDPFLSEACRILEIDEKFNKDLNFSKYFDIIHFQQSPPVRFNKKYLQAIKKSDFITLVLNSNLVAINGQEGRINDIEVADYKKNIYRLKLKNLILATGGIENSRILLWNQYRNKSLFKDLKIGGGWMEHPHFSTGEIIIDNDEKLKKILKSSERTESGAYKIFLQPTDEFMKKRGINNAGIRFELYKSKNKLKRVINDILCINKDYGDVLLKKLTNKNLMCSANVTIAWEQFPQVRNNIKLDFAKKDKFGIPSPILNWRVNKYDKKTALECMRELSKVFIDNNLGRVGIYEYLSEDYSELDEDYGGGCCISGGHHIGGTPMGQDKSSGVVDRDLKVFGVDNMWVLGSSVFPRGGHVNPTLSIIQLSLRLGKFFREGASMIKKVT